jgi:hypothetical protein
VVPEWKRWSPILLRPEGLYGTRPAMGGNKAAKLKAIREALRSAKREATDGRPRRWCILAFIRGASHEALQYAVDRNWEIRREGNTACLTDEGRKLITKGFN